MVIFGHGKREKTAMLKFLSLALDKFFEKSPPDWVFIPLYNFRNFLTTKRKNRGSDFESRLSWNRSKGQYFLRTRSRSIRVSNLVLANHTYKNGLIQRASEIGNVYHLNLIDFSHEDIVVDCGANLGDLYLYFSLQGLQVNYFGFEPSILDFDCLHENILDENAQLYKKGLFNKDGELSLYVSVSGADSSLINPGFFDRVESIEVLRLDSLSFKKIKLFKVEAEGAEPEVLEGATGLLPIIEYISVDAGFERGEKQESTLVDVINFLTGHNFELVALSHSRVVALFKNTLIGVN